MWEDRLARDDRRLQRTASAERQPQTRRAPTGVYLHPSLIAQRESRRSLSETLKDLPFINVQITSHQHEQLKIRARKQR